MFNRISALFFSLLLLFVSMTCLGCGGNEANTVVAPPSDEAARQAALDAEAAYDKELENSGE